MQNKKMLDKTQCCHFVEQIGAMVKCAARTAAAMALARRHGHRAIHSPPSPPSPLHPSTSIALARHHRHRAIHPPPPLHPPKNKNKSHNYFPSLIPQPHSPFSLTPLLSSHLYPPIFSTLFNSNSQSLNLPNYKNTKYC